MGFSLFKRSKEPDGPARDKLAVLFVCTGNICRSPTAEAVLRHKLAEVGLDEKVDVDSAGLIDYHVGSPPDARGMERAQLRGYDLSDLRARRFHKRDFHEFDLIISMDRGHHMQLLSRCPDGKANRLRLFMEFVPEGAGGTDVPDPYAGEISDYELVLDLVEPGVDGLIEELKRDHL